MPSKSSGKHKSTAAKRKAAPRKPAARGGASPGARVRPAKPARVVARPAARSGSRPGGKAEGPPPVPNAMGLLVAHVDFTTHNFDEVRRFYTQQMGFTRFDYDQQFSYLKVETTGSSSLGFSPPPPGYNLPQPPREPTLYFMVKDIDEAYRKLMARGVSFEAPPETMPWGHRVVRTRDPEGRAIWIAQTGPPPRDK